MSINGKNLDRVVNEQMIVERIYNEAETKEEMLLAINAELLALGTLYSKDYFDITMYDRAKDFPNADYVAVGQVAETEEDFDDDYYGYIIPKSYIKNGEYIVEYKIIWKNSI